MDYVFVKDSEGYVFKKLENEVYPDEKVISEKEYMKISGLSSYEKNLGMVVLEKTPAENRNLHYL